MTARSGEHGSRGRATAADWTIAGRLAGEAAAARRPRVGSARLALLWGTEARLQPATGRAELGLSSASSIPKRASTAITRCTRLGKMNSFARKDCSHRRRGASPPPSRCFLRGRRAQLSGERSSSTLTAVWLRPPHTPLWALMAPRHRTLAGQLSVCALSCCQPTEAQTRRNDYN